MIERPYIIYNFRGRHVDFITQTYFASIYKN